MRDIASPLDGFASPFGPGRRTLTNLLFGQSEPGFTFEPWDISTLYQDRAGTTPVTAVGQSVGKRLDKSGRGNHEVAINDAARGVYGREPKTGRRNLLTSTEQFDNAVWIKSNATVTANTIIAPDGTTTADKLTETTATNEHIANYALASITSTVYTGTIYIKASERTFTRLSFANLANGSVWFNLSTGLVGTKQSAVTTATIVNMGNGWYRCSATWAANGVSNYFTVGVASADNVATYTGDGTSGVYIWGAQLELGASATAYQRVVSQYDITEAGVASCYYVQTDGVDDACVTPTITPGTDKVQVFAGLQKIGTGATEQIIAEMSVTRAANNGAFTVGVPGSVAGAGAFLVSRGTVDATAQVTTGYTPPVQVVVTALADISGDVATLRVNGAQIAQAVTDQGTGNFLAYPAYLYARGGTTQPAALRDYGHVIRFGPNLDAATIARVEALIARNTPTVTL